MDVDVIANKDLSLSIRISFTNMELKELGTDANVLADEMIKDIAKQLNIDSDYLKFDTEQEPERHIRTATKIQEKIKNRNQLEARR